MGRLFLYVVFIGLVLFGGCSNPASSDGGGGGGGGGIEEPIGEDPPNSEDVDTFLGMPTIEISGVTAQVLQGADIQLVWGSDGRTGGTYKIYRSTYSDFGVSKSGGPFYTLAKSTQKNTCIDDPPDAFTPYFYVVSYTPAGGTEGVMSTAPVLGLNTDDASLVDIGESNDEHKNAKPISVGSTLDQQVIFSVRDGAGKVILDTDWYYIVVKPGDAGTDAVYFVTVALQGDAGDQELVHFQYGYAGAAQESFNFSSGTFGSVPLNTLGLSAELRLYFKVTVETSEEDAFIPYSITISDEL